MNTIIKFPAAIAVICAHVITAILIILGLGEAGLHTTPLSLIALVVNNKAWLVAIILIVTSLLASVPFIVTLSRGAFVACIAPQQVLLVLHCTSVMLAISSGHYPDGYVPAGGGYFIAIDQIWLLMISFWHTFEYAQI